MPIRTPLQALAAAGKDLKLYPETFEAEMGGMHGNVIGFEVKEETTPAPKRIISYNGEVAAIPGRRVYKTTLTIVWDLDSAKEAVEALKVDLKDHLEQLQEKLRTRMEYADLADLEYFFENRE